MTTRGNRNANTIGLQCLVDQCLVLGQEESSIFSEKPSSRMTCKEGQLSPHELGTRTFQSKHSHPQWNQESVKGRGEAQKVGALSTPKNTNPRTKEMLRQKATSLF